MTDKETVYDWHTLDYKGLERLWRAGVDKLVVHTSGSTGRPKEIALSRAIIEGSALRTIRHFGLNESTHLHSCLSPQTIGGRMVLIRALECNGLFSFEEPSNRPLSQFGPDDRLTMISVVPSQMLHILDRHDSGTLPEIDVILIGGAPIPEGLRARIASSGLQCYESYGMTETASHIAVRKVETTPRGFSPMPGISVSADERGCLVIVGATKERIITNDVVSFDDEGRFTVLGRADNAIITGGRKCLPEVIEASLYSLLPSGFNKDSIRLAVTGFPDPKWGQKIVVGYVCDDSDAEICQAWLKTASPQITPYWSRPVCARRLSHFPATPSGKIDRKALAREISERDGTFIPL